MHSFPFAAFRWETPPITSTTTHRPFEFVLRNASGLIGPADRQAFASHFTDDVANDGVVAFANLGGAAILVAPSPRGPGSAYGHIAAFARNAPADQPHSFWRSVGQTVQRALGSSALDQHRGWRGRLAACAPGFTAKVL